MSLLNPRTEAVVINQGVSTATLETVEVPTVPSVADVKVSHPFVTECGVHQKRMAVCVDYCRVCQLAELYSCHGGLDR